MHKLLGETEERADFCTKYFYFRLVKAVRNRVRCFSFCH